MIREARLAFLCVMKVQVLSTCRSSTRHFRASLRFENALTTQIIS